MSSGEVIFALLAAAGLAWGCSSGAGGQGPSPDALEVADGASAGGTAGSTSDAAPDRAAPEMSDGPSADQARPAASDGGSEPGPDAPAGPQLARTWTARNSGVSVGLESLAAGPSAIVAAGHDAVIVSNDGVSWRKPRSPVVASQVAFGAGTFVAASRTGDVAWSADGDTWTAATVPMKAIDPDVAFGAGTFALVAHGYGGAWLASPDGSAWTVRTVEPADVRSAWNLVFTAFGAGPYLFASKSTPLPDGNFVTMDRMAWSVVSEWRGITYDLAFDGSTYCASGSVGFTHRSTDGKSWSSSMTVAESLLTITSLNGTFYLAGTYGTVLASRDCVTWEEGASPRMPMDLPSGEQLAFDGIRAFKGRLVLVGTAGSLFTSP